MELILTILNDICDRPEKLKKKNLRFFCVDRMS